MDNQGGIAECETKEILGEPLVKRKERKPYNNGHRYFSVDTLDNYLKTLKEHLPEGLKYFKSGACPGFTTPLQTFYIVIEKKDRPLNWDERWPMNHGINDAEKGRNLVAELDPKTGEFGIDTHIQSSLYREDPSEPNHVVIGIVGPRAKHYGDKLYNVIKKSVINIRQD